MCHVFIYFTTVTLNLFLFSQPWPLPTTSLRHPSHHFMKEEKLSNTIPPPDLGAHLPLCSPSPPFSSYLLRKLLQLISCPPSSQGFCSAHDLFLLWCCHLLSPGTCSSPSPVWLHVSICLPPSSLPLSQTSPKSRLHPHPQPSPHGNPALIILSKVNNHPPLMVKSRGSFQSWPYGLKNARSMESGTLICLVLFRIPMFSVHTGLWLLLADWMDLSFFTVNSPFPSKDILYLSYSDCLVFCNPLEVWLEQRQCPWYFHHLIQNLK